MMEISNLTASTTTLAAASQQLQTTMQAQVSMLRELADSQRQVAQMLAENGIGQAIDVEA